MDKLLYGNAEITWKTAKSTKTMQNVDIHDDGEAYRLFFKKLKNGQIWYSNKRVWKKNVISINVGQ